MNSVDSGSSRAALIRLEPMGETDFRGFMDRAIPRRAAKWADRGIWSDRHALEASREMYGRTLPSGRDTPGNHFVNLIESTSGVRVGEAWYLAELLGGKMQFWVEWIQVEPGFRRKGYATAALQALEELARGLGADRIGLTVWADNPGASELYTKLGYRPASQDLTKRLEPRT